MVRLLYLRYASASGVCLSARVRAWEAMPRFEAPAIDAHMNWIHVLRGPMRPRVAPAPWPVRWIRDGLIQYSACRVSRWGFVRCRYTRTDVHAWETRRSGAHGRVPACAEVYIGHCDWSEL